MRETRLLLPHLRRSMRVPVEQAMGEIARKLAAIRDGFGPAPMTQEFINRMTA